MKKTTLKFYLFLLWSFIVQLITKQKQRAFLFTFICLLFTSLSNAQFDYANETEPNNLTTDTGVQTLTVAGANTTTIIGGSATVGSDEDYFKIGRSPFVLGNIFMSVQSNSGSMQPEVWLEKRTGSYDGTLVSSNLIHPGTDQSNRAMNISYTAANEYYLIRVGGGRSGGYSYRVNFPRCDTPGLATSLTTESTETDFTVTGIGGGSYISLVKINTVNSFTNPTSGTTYPTADGTSYSGSGEQTVYVGNSTTPNVAVTGLSVNTTYYVKVFNYSDCGGNLRLNAGNVFTVNTCGAAPTTATALTLSSNNHVSSYISSITGSIGASKRYVVKVNTTNSFTAPTNGAALPTANTVYSGGEQVVYAGDSATPNTLVTGLTTGIEYFFKVYTAELCGGNYYFETTGAGSSITPVCASPNSNAGIYLYAEPTNTHNSIGVVNFTGNNNADGKIIYVSDQNNFTLPTTLPVASIPSTSTDYSGKTGQAAIYSGAGNGFRVVTTGLSPNTTYYFAAINYKTCNGALYFFPTAIYSQRLTCGVTSALASTAVLNNVDVTSMDLNSFTAPSAVTNAPDGYVIKMNTANSFSPLAIGTTLPTGSTVYGGGEQVIYSGTSVTPNLNITGLTEGTQYYFSVYAYKDCSGTPIYQQTGYTFSQSTLGLSFTPPTLTYGSVATTLNATTTSTGAMAYSLVDDTTGASLNGSDLTPGGVGTSKVRVTVAADGIYKSISKDYTITISKGNPVITWSAPATIAAGVAIDATYLNASANITGIFEYYTGYNSFAKIFSGKITQDVTTLNTTSSITNLYVRFIPTNTNYNIGVANSPITITSVGGNTLEITPNDIIKALGSAEPTLTSSFTIGRLNSGDIIWVPLKREPGETAGTYVISVDQTAQAPASFDPSGVCPSGVCIGADPFRYGYIDTEDFGFGNPITNGNYTIQLKTGTFTVSTKEQLTLTIDPATLANTYYNTNPRNSVTFSNVVVTSTGVAPATTPTVNFVYSGGDYQGNTYGPSATPPMNAGSYTVKATVDTGDLNYFGSVTGSFNILQHTIVINPDNPQFKLYDGTPQTFEATAKGLSGENIPLSFNYRVGSYYTEAAPIAIGTYPVLIRPNTSVNNYSLYFNGSLTITDKTEVTINLANLSHQYNGTQKPATIASIETTPGVTATPTPNAVVTYEGINGTSYTKSTTAPTYGGTYKVHAYIDATDANFFGSTTATLTIFQKEYVTINFGSESLTYNGNSQTISIQSITDSNDVVITPSHTISYSGTDVDDNDYGPSNTPPSKAGDYTVTVTIDASDPAYEGSDNYGFSIARRAITVTADAKMKMYGAVDPALTYQITSGSLVNSDAFTGGLARVTGESVGDYSINRGSLALSSSYNLTYVSKNLTIGKKAIEITADTKAKVYGDSDPTLTYQITSGSLVNSDAFTGGLARVVGESIGDYAINQGSLALSSNYILTYVSKNLSITKRAIEVTADAKSKAYGAVDPILTYTVTSGSLANSDVFTGSLIRVTGETVGDYAINQGSLALSSNYTLTYVSENLSITKRAIEITADAKTKMYGAVDPIFTYQITSGSLVNSDAFSGTLLRVSGENVGNYAINQGTLALNANYNVSFVSADLNISARAIEVTADAKAKVYGDSDPTFTYQITSGNLVGGDVFTGALSRATGETVGDYAINQGTLTAGANYNVSFVSNDLTIGKKAIEVTADIKTKIYGDADPTLTYQITSGNLVGGDVFTGDLTRVSGENIGNYAINQGTLTIGANYNVSFVSSDLTIGKKAIEVTADTKSKVYGDSDPTLTYQITSGILVGGDVFTGILSREVGETVFNNLLSNPFYAITQGTLELNANYDLTFVDATFRITSKNVNFSLESATKVYGETDPLPVLNIVDGTSMVNGDALILKKAPRIVGENVGNYSYGGVFEFEITSSGSTDVRNYQFNFRSYGSPKLTINQRSIEVTADAKTKIYGAVDPTFTYQITSGSLVNSDAFTGTLSRVSGETVGDYAINQGTLALNANYNVSFVSADLNISARAIEVTANAKTKIYGAVDPTFTYQITSGSLVNSDAFTGTLSRASGETVGDYAINQGTLALNTNYNVSFVSADLNISARAIEVTADAKTKIYGAVDPTFTYQITSGSLVNSDAFTGTLSRVSGENVGNYAINQGTLALNANYNVSFVSANLNISARSIEVTADAKTKIYGAVDPTFSYQITSGSLVNSDAFAGSLTRTSGENVGNYVITQGSLALSSNYILTYVSENLSITKRAIEVTADAKTKVYGDVDPTLTYQITNGSLVSGDVFTGSFTRVSGETVGDYAITQGSLTVGSNYTLTYIAKNLSITKRTIEITADAKTKVYGDVDPTLTYQITNGSLVSGDAFTGSLTRVSGENIGNYAIIQGSIALNSNYTLIYVSKNLSITKRTVEVTADANSKEYGDVDPTLTYQITNGSLVGNDTFTGALIRVSGEARGTYAMSKGTLEVNTNYTLNFVGNNFTIGKRTIEITADAKTKVYGDVDPTLTYQITNGSLVSGDVFTGSLTRALGETVGDYAITQGSLTINSNYTLTYVAGIFSITSGVNQVIWDGSTNSVWRVGTNWSNDTTPLTSNNVLIPNVVTTPNIVSGVQINDLTVESLSSFDISENGSVTVDGNFTNVGTFKMLSTAANSSSLLVKGTANGMISYERGGLVANKWSIVSAPVSGQRIKDFVENPTNNIRINSTVTPNRYAVGYYDDSRSTGNKWVYYTVDDLASNTITFEKGKSYAISRATNGSVTFTGSVETTNATKAVTASEWNSVGNPYTAFLPINENGDTNFINDNLASFDPAYVGTYVWDNAQNKYVAKSLVSGASSLAPGQGFFVKTATGAGSISFKEAQRMTQPVSGGTFSRGEDIPTIELSIASKGTKVNTTVSYRENATKGLDTGYDVGNFDGSQLDIYTRLLDNSSEKNFTYQSLPIEGKESYIIPVGIKAKEGTLVTISAKGIGLEGMEIYLEDKELEKFINLNEEDYLLTIAKVTNGVGRFYLHTKAQVEIPEVSLADIKLYNINNKLFVEGVQGEQFKLTMYNTSGALVYKDTFKGTGKNNIDLPTVEVGVYIVRVATNVGIKSKKIILKK